MEVIVAEDQLSLAIGKKGQNVRLATRLVGWDIDIVSEEILKKEIAQQMGRMMASGEAVPLTALQGVSPNQAELLAEKGISDVESLAAMTVDDLVDTLDLSLDEAERIISAAQTVVEAKNQEITQPDETATESSEQVVNATEDAEGEQRQPAAEEEADENGESSGTEPETTAASSEASVSTHGAGGQGSVEPAGEIETAPEPPAESNE